MDAICQRGHGAIRRSQGRGAIDPVAWGLLVSSIIARFQVTELVAVEGGMSMARDVRAWRVREIRAGGEIAV